MYSSSFEVERFRKISCSFTEKVSAGTASGAGDLNLVKAAGLNSAQKNFVIIRVCALCVLSVILTAHFASIYWLCPTVVGVYFEYLFLKKRIYRRAENFEKDYTAFLLTLATGVRTGLDPLSAFCGAAELFSSGSEVKKEILALQSAIDSGASEESAVLNFARSIQHPDTGLFRTAFILARKHGSSLAGCLQRLAKVTRQRQSFRRKCRSAVAMQRLSAFGITACAVVIAAMQYCMNPKALLTAISQPLGVRLICFGVGLMLVGIVWMMNLSKTRI